MLAGMMGVRKTHEVKRTGTGDGKGVHTKDRFGCCCGSRLPSSEQACCCSGLLHLDPLRQLELPFGLVLQLCRDRGSGDCQPGRDRDLHYRPSMPGAACTVTSNSGCAANKFTCSLSADGLKASVVVGATACGSLDIAVTKAATASCAQYSASATVRINNTGQGGDWVLVEAYHPDLCCSGCWQCTVLSGNCITGQYRVGAWNNPYGNWSSACNCQPLHPTCEKLADCTKAPGYCVTADCSTVMGGPYGNQHCSLCVWWSWGLWEWKCTCN